MKNYHYILLFTLLTIGIGTRFFFLTDGESMLPNFTAIGAVALFGANYLKGSFRFLVPFIALWVSDLVLNNIVYTQYYDGFQVIGSPWVYSAFLLTVLAAILIMKKPSWGNLLLACLGSGVVFYLITNFGVWLSPTSPYSKDFFGLMNCYLAALPFFRNTLLGNVFYAGVLFGVYEIVMLKGFRMKTNRLLTVS